ncbi:MAG: hypothetical protein IAE91_02465 [Ignavibacteriaceae bacterium]|nr:hypothetical protein [Ignavibacteriaceae bacterium]
MSSKENIFKEFCEQVIARNNLLLVEIVFRGNKNEKVIEVYIDSGEILTVDDIANISREINEFIETENLFEGRYRLDVSSPGIERPLIFLQQFPKNTGRSFEIEYKLEGSDVVEKFKGKLLKVEGNNLVFEDKKFEKIIDFQNLINAKVKVSFS